MLTSAFEQKNGNAVAVVVLDPDWDRRPRVPASHLRRALPGLRALSHETKNAEISSQIKRQSYRTQKGWFSLA